MNKLYLKPRGGLCNRLLAVASCLRLCALFERELLLEWKPTVSCYCHWNDLFSNTIPAVSSECVPHSNCLSLTVDARDVLYKGAKPFIDLQSTNQDVVVSSNVLLSYPDDPIRGDSFWTFEPIIAECSRWLNTLKPVPLISERIAAVISQFKPGRTTGIHLRRGIHDERACQRKFRRISDADFAWITEMIPSSQREVHFVASDAQSSIEYFVSRYSETIRFYPKRSNAKWNEPEAIQDALIDLLCLAACDRIVGHHNSTFSFVAVMFRLPAYYEVWPLRERDLLLKKHIFSTIEGAYRHNVIEQSVMR